MREVAEVGRGGLDDRTHRRGHGPRAHGQPDGTVVQAAEDPTESREELARLVAALLVAGAVGVVARGSRRRVADPSSGPADGRRPDLQRRFVADASHELRTPLTLLSTRAQLLDRHMTADWGDVRRTGCGTTSTVCSPTRRH